MAPDADPVATDELAEAVSKDQHALTDGGHTDTEPRLDVIEQEDVLPTIRTARFG